MFQANRTYEYWIQRGLANKVLEIAPRRTQIERSRLRGSQPQLYCHVSEGIVHLELRGQDLKPLSLLTAAVICWSENLPPEPANTFAYFWPMSHHVTTLRKGQDYHMSLSARCWAYLPRLLQLPVLEPWTISMKSRWNWVEPGTVWQGQQTWKTLDQAIMRCRLPQPLPLAVSDLHDRGANLLQGGNILPN
jgi:hypothetical protein